MVEGRARASATTVTITIGDQMKAKRIGKRLLVTLIAFLLCHHSIKPAVAATQPKAPNIIVILADDLGYSDLRGVNANSR